MKFAAREYTISPFEGSDDTLWNGDSPAFIAVSGNIGILIAPIVAAFFITGLGIEKVQAYTLLFVIAGILSVLAAIFVQPIKGIR